ncbi:hypothetical protein [Lysinibacillus sphaericus]|nr:hypothetical protein [Lysinibacillus sphaericus]
MQAKSGAGVFCDDAETLTEKGIGVHNAKGSLSVVALHYFNIIPP